MSDNIPFEIQTEIIKRVLPVESLIRFRSVSKQWKSLIDSHEFITRQSIQNNAQQPHHLLISYAVDSEQNYVSIVDDGDDSFPQHNRFTPVVPQSVNLFGRPLSMIGSSHGLVCLSGVGPDPHLIVLWNPSIRKSVGVMPPPGTNIAGFGLCPNTNDPKIIALTRDMEAEVFTLSTKTWRSVPMNMFHTSVKFNPKQVVIDGVIHWCGTGYDPDGAEHKTIVSFDLSSDEFRQLALPDRLTRFGCVEISKLKDSLAVIEFRPEDDSGHLIHDVWVRKNGVPNSYTKLYTVHDKASIYRIIGFRMNGQPVVAQSVGSWEHELQVYEPNSQHMNSLGIYGLVFRMVNYAESLLLLDHPDSIILPYN